MTTTYRNPWHQPATTDYGPAMYSTDATPVEYRGHLIYQRVRGQVWDVVRDGVCITQRAGANGAREAIDEIVSAERAA